MRSYKETLDYLDSFVNYEIVGLDGIKEKFDLGKLHDALRSVGDPHKDYKCVHVAGTKGKGSVCVFTSVILQGEGHSVGLFTSPHLVDPKERIRVNGDEITEEELTSAATVLRDSIEGGTERFTYFEIYTMIAMLHFSIKKVDFAVFEVGLGGQLDSTNVIDAKVCGISPISYDHMNVLGNSLGEIATEKAGIIKKGAHCVSAPQTEDAMDVIRERCADQDATLSVVGEDITYKIISMDAEGSKFDVRTPKGTYENCRTVMPGDFQAMNCAVAISLAEQALGGRELDMGKLTDSLSRAFLPGRMEVLATKPFIVIDGAQNGDSSRCLKYSVEQIFKYDRLILLFGISKDKDIKSTCRELGPVADEIILTRAAVDRAADPHLVRGFFKGKSVKVTRDVKEALGLALKAAGKRDIILATGSFFVAGEVRELVLGTQEQG
ncbi:MAG: folylpolyglutamate synthase/dihydrofolate synthase family protein [Candidatus Tantalella remota]|nr:folylpolyglutamate synthase/dihydrofolate synthase family protein [Candidatus Tantalella remota]